MPSGPGCSQLTEEEAGLREWHPLAGCSFAPDLMTIRVLAQLHVPSASLSSKERFSLIQRVALMSLLR